MASSSIRFEHRGKVIEWTTETPASEIERLLPEMMRDRGWLATQADRAIAQRWLSEDKAARADVMQQFVSTLETQETEMATKSASETAAPTAPGLENVRGMNAIASTAEGRIALQRWRNGQDLDPAQSRLVEQYRSYEKQHNDAADASRVSKEPRKNLGTYIPGDVMPFATNQNKVQRLQQAAEHRVKVLNNPAHPYWNASSGEHKSAVLGMKIAQEMLQNGGDSFVHIDPDGSIEDEK